MSLKRELSFALGGTATTADFATNGWSLYESVNVDEADPIANATLVGSSNIGDVFPDSVGLFMSGQILDGDTHYFYVTAAIDAAATAGNTFNVVLTSPNPLGSFGITAPKNRIDGGLTDGDTFTIVSGDAIAPTPVITSAEVISTNVNPIPISIDFGEVVTGFAVTDLTVGNGTAQNFVDVDGQTYTVDVVPTADGTISIDIAAAVAQDGAANDNLAATQFTIVFDGTRPIHCLRSGRSDDQQYELDWNNR